MNKHIAIVLSLVCTASLAIAAISVVNNGTFSGSDTASTAVTVTIPASDGGQIVNQGFSLNTSSNTTVTVFRPLAHTTAYMAEAADNEITVFTTIASNNVQGVTVAAADSVLVGNKTGGYTLVGVAGVRDYTATTNITAYDLDSTLTVAAGDTVWICDAGDNASISAVAAEDQTDMRWKFTGFADRPVVVKVPSTGEDITLSGTYTVER